MSVRRVKSTAEKLLRFGEDRRGAVAIVLALLLPILIAGLAFGAEVGFWELQHRKLQNAADTAAYAAATQLRSGVTDSSQLKPFAKSVAEVSGYIAGDPGITVSTPPASGAYAGNASAVQVTLLHSIPRRFSKIYNSTPVEFTVQSTALVEQGRPACLLALSRTAPKAVNFTGSTSVTLSGCDVASNSIASNAVNMGGAAAHVETDCVSTVGGVSDAHSGIQFTNCPAALEGMPLTRDPYESLAEPAEASQACQSASEEQQWTKKKGAGHPKPGRYCGGQHVKGDVNLTSGVYVLDGGAWTFNASSNVSGSGVALYITGGATLTINGGAKFDLEAMAIGPLAGVVLFFDRNDSGLAHKLNGGATLELDGAVYAPTADLTINGGTSAGAKAGCTQIVANTIEYSGNASFNATCNWNGKRSIQTAQSIRIVE